MQDYAFNLFNKTGTLSNTRLIIINSMKLVYMENMRRLNPSALCWYKICLIDIKIVYIKEFPDIVATPTAVATAATDIAPTFHQVFFRTDLKGFLI